MALMLTYANRSLQNHRFAGSYDRPLSGKDLYHTTITPLTQQIVGWDDVDVR